jgi:hypothetical protein
MPLLIRFANPIRLDKKTRIGVIRGADLYVHWTVFLVAAVILAGALQRPAFSLLGLIAHWGVLFLHEVGHLIAAQRFGCPVFPSSYIRLGAFLGLEHHWSRLDHCVIAWAGVAVQAVIALPVVSGSWFLAIHGLKL